MINFRPHQIQAIEQGLEILRERKLLLLYLKMRLGKTLTSMEILNRYGAKRVLFVTTLKAMHSVKEDYKTLAPDYEIDFVSMDSVYNAKRFKKYELTRNHFKDIKKLKYMRLDPNIYTEYDAIIVDEVHGFSGNGAKESLRGAILKKLCSNLPMIQLSGTPTPETWTGLYYQLSLSKHSPFSNYLNFYKWSYDYINTKQVERNGRLINDYSNAKIEKIKPIIEPLSIMMTTDDAGFTHTGVKEIIHQVETPACLIKMIQDITSHGITTYQKQVIVADTAVKRQGKVHQLSSGTVIINNEVEDDKYVIISNFKIDYIKKAILPKYQKLAIFYKFQSELEQLKSLPNTTTSAPEFEQSDNLIYLGQFISSREGVKLSTADALLFYNMDFSYVSYEQAKARLQHQNRETEPILLLLFTSHGLEADVYDAVKRKKKYDSKMFRKRINSYR